MFVALRSNSYNLTQTTTAEINKMIAVRAMNPINPENIPENCVKVQQAVPTVYRFWDKMQWEHGRDEEVQGV